MESKAKKYGATDFGKSDEKNKRYFVIYKNNKINFGLLGGHTFIDHHNKSKQNAYKARHSQIFLKDGTPAYKNKLSPAFWSWNLLWS